MKAWYRKLPAEAYFLKQIRRNYLQRNPLKADAREAISIGRFYIYLALTKPSEKLIISYAVSGVGR